MEDDRSGVQLERLGWLAGASTIAMVVVIVLATGFPFHFSAELTQSRRVGFFLFWLTPVAKNWIGWGLNVAFFMPFGSCLAWWAWTRGWSLLRSGLVVGLSACLLSCAVEYMQLYLPIRSSSWDDVAMNTLGAVVGWLVFEWLGLWVLRMVSEVIEELASMFES